MARSSDAHLCASHTRPGTDTAPSASPMSVGPVVMGYRVALREKLDATTYSHSLQCSDNDNHEQRAPHRPMRDEIHDMLVVLGEEAEWRRLSRRVLFTLGRHLIDPVLAASDPTFNGPAQPKRELRQVRRLLHEMLGLLSSTLAHVLRVWPQESGRIADSIAGRVRAREQLVPTHRPHDGTFANGANPDGPPSRVVRRHGPVVRRICTPNPYDATLPVPAGSLDLPLLRDAVVDALEEYLWTETASELNAALQRLFTQPEYDSFVLVRCPKLDRKAFREFAVSCWELVAERAATR